jgi:hypothetical protein
VKTVEERDHGGSGKPSHRLTPVYTLSHAPVVYARQEMRIDPRMAAETS